MTLHVKRLRPALQPRARKSFRPALSARCAAAVLVAAGFGLPWPAPAAEPSASSDMAVTVVPAKNMCFADTLQVTGVLVRRNEILVRPEREGLQISQVMVEPGDTVVSGQVLARLAPPEGQEGGGGGTTGSTAVRAPAAGGIASASAVVGATASARAEPLFRIAGRGEMELLADTPVKTLASLAVDQPAKVEVVGVGELAGKVRRVSTAINPTQ